MLTVNLAACAHARRRVGVKGHGRDGELAVNLLCDTKVLGVCSGKRDNRGKAVELRDDPIPLCLKMSILL